MLWKRKSHVAKEKSGRGRRRCREKGNQGVGDFRSIIFYTFFLNYFSLSFFFLYSFYPRYLPTPTTSTHYPRHLATLSVKLSLHFETATRLNLKLPVKKLNCSSNHTFYTCLIKVRKVRKWHNKDIRNDIDKSELQKTTYHYRLKERFVSFVLKGQAQQTNKPCHITCWLR